MLTPMNDHLKLKRQAMHLMLTGDMERYMRTLRELYALRMLKQGRLA